MDNKDSQYIIDFINLVKESYRNDIDGYEKIKRHILNYGYISMDILAQFMPVKNQPLLKYNKNLLENYGWTQFGKMDSSTITAANFVYYDVVTKSIKLTLPINIKENKMNKEYAIGQLNTIINSNPDNDAEGTQDTTTVRLTDEDYEYTIVRKDKIKYLPLSSIKPHKEYKVIPRQTLWEEKHDVTFSYVMKVNPLISMITLFTLFPRGTYSYEARSKLYDDLSFNLNNPGINKVLLVFIGKDNSNKDVLEVMVIDQDSSFFDGKRVIVKGDSK